MRDPTEDTHSIYGDSDLMSSDGREQVPLSLLDGCCNVLPHSLEADQSLRLDRHPGSRLG